MRTSGRQIYAGHSGLSRLRLVHQCCQVPEADCAEHHAYNVSGLIDDQRGRLGGDRGNLGDLLDDGEAGVVNAGVGDAVLVHEGQPGARGFVHVVTEEVHSLSVVLLVSRFEGGCLGGAGPAPRSPDVEYHDLAQVARHLDGGAGQRGRVEVRDEWLVPGGVLDRVAVDYAAPGAAARGEVAHHQRTARQCYCGRCNGDDRPAAEVPWSAG